MDSIIESDNGRVGISLVASVWPNVDVFEVDLELVLYVCALSFCLIVAIMVKWSVLTLVLGSV